MNDYTYGIWDKLLAILALVPLTTGKGRAPRVRPYAVPLPFRRPHLPALPTLTAPAHGPDVGPVAVVRPYVLDELHCARRRRAHKARVDRSRLGCGVLLDLGASRGRAPAGQDPHPIPEPRDGSAAEVAA